MIKVFDFRCTNGHVFEDFVEIALVQPLGAVVVLTLQKSFQQHRAYSTVLLVTSPEDT